MEYHTNEHVRFRVELSREHMAAVERIGLLKAFKLQTTLSTLNMHLFDTNGHIRKFTSPLAILTTYFPIRLSHYTHRRSHLLTQLTTTLHTLTLRTRFIRLVTSHTVAITGVKRADLLAALAAHGLQGEGVEGLLDMRVGALSVEEVERLEGERARCEAEVRRVEGLTAERMWEADLDRLETRLVKLLDSEAGKQVEGMDSTKKSESSDRREKRVASESKRSTGGVNRSSSRGKIDRVARQAKKQVQ